MAEVVCITGACGDIGRSLALEFARNKASLALCDLLTEDAADELFSKLRQFGTRLFYRPVDVTDAAAIRAFIDEAEATLGALDVCIANAGIVERGLLVDLEPEAWRRTLDVNLTGCFLTAQAAARNMISAGRKGHILLISSWVQDVPRESIGAYCASKSGIQMLGKCLALELAPHGIRVNLVAPGFVDAGLTGQNLKINPSLRPQMESQVPLGRLVGAEELARTIRLLCSADASYITGTTLLVDGGSSLCPRRTQS